METSSAPQCFHWVTLQLQLLNLCLLLLYSRYDRSPNRLLTFSFSSFVHLTPAPLSLSESLLSSSQTFSNVPPWLCTQSCHKLSHCHKRRKNIKNSPLASILCLTCCNVLELEHPTKIGMSDFDYFSLWEPVYLCHRFAQTWMLPKL